ncbi:MAG: carbohydrate ABC transporter permease [Oliverpabstia sp.]
MRIKQKKRINVYDIVSAILGVLLLVIVLYPIYFVVIASFSNPASVANGEVWLWPKNITFAGYKKIFQESKIWLGYKNTILYTIVGTLFSLAFTIPAAYALSRKDLKGRNAIMMFFTFTMFFSGGLIPTYLIMNNVFHLTNTFWVIVLPFSVSAYNLIVSRTFFESSIPDELWEAAQLDGCSNTRFFMQVVVPLSKAIIAVIALYCAVGQWNQYFISLVYVRDDKLVSLQMVLRDMLLQNETLSASVTSDYEVKRVVESMKYAVILISTLPILCVYPFVQKYFSKGVMIGAVKG